MTTELTRSAERALVAGPLVRGASELALVRAAVDARDFSDVKFSRVVFEAECRVVDAGRDLTITAVAGALEAMGAAIGIEQLRQLAEADLPGERADLATRIVNAARVRLTARKAARLAEIGQTAEALADPDRYLAAVSRVADEAALHVKRDAVGPVEAVRDGIAAWESRGKKLRAAPFGMVSVDALFDGGLEPATFLLLAARPGVGKTAAAIQTMYHMASRGHPQMMFELEMPVRTVVGRGICNRTGMDSNRWKLGPRGLTKSEAEGVYREALALSRMPVHIVTTERDVGTMLAKARVWLDTVARPLVKAGPAVESDDGVRESALVPVVWLDYMQLATLAGKFNTRDEQIGEMGRLCAAFSVAEECVVAAVVAINRGPVKEKRAPTIADLRECGALEYHANKVILIHRDAGAQDDGPGPVVEQECEWIVDKNREGQVGRVKLTWKGPSQRFVVPQFMPRGGYGEDAYDAHH